MRDLKCGASEPVYTAETRLTHVENRLVVAKGEGEGWEGWEGGVSRCQRRHLDWRSKEAPLCRAGNHVQSLETEHDGREYEKKKVYACV